MTESRPKLEPLGDCAITVALGNIITRELSRAVLRSMRSLLAAHIDGVTDIVPSYASLAVFYDAIAVDYDDMCSRISAALSSTAIARPIDPGMETATDTEMDTESDPEIDTATDIATGTAAHTEIDTRSESRDRGRVVQIPVHYDGEDLDDVSRLTGLSRAEIIELHSQREYTALVIGFAPGFAYLGELDPRLSLPRRSSPRKRVPAGSVAIAEAQTAVYPSSTPGGWHLIGTTDLVMFDPRRTPPALLRVGDNVVFENAAE